jgi:murein DD-endopeptidase MepM/ murein hydrolase activator NlpD
MKLSNIQKKYFIFLSALFATSAIMFVKNIGIDLKSTPTQGQEKAISSVAATVPVGELEQALDEGLSLEEQYPHMIGRNKPLYTTLRELDVNSLDIVEMARAAKPVRSLSFLLPGTRFQIVTDKKDNLIEVEFRFSAVEKLNVKKIDQKWVATKITEDVDIKTISFVGQVETTLWESALFASMDPYLIFEMSEIFGWEVDFNREVQSGDSWRITAEQKFVKGEPVGWGSVLAAEYVNQGRTYSAILFRLNGEDIGYYGADGENLRRMFLKSPLKFGRITSRFNRRRFHPKLRIVRPHNGVDYGAPIGTPVRSVADGTVTFAAYSGGGGKVLKLRHNATYQTAYKHLNGYAKGIRKGARVRQGQIIAYVGNTGLSTGPHLHYEFYVNGRFVDPLRQKFPSADPIAEEHKALFLKQAEKLVAALPKWDPTNFTMEPERTWSQHMTPNIQDKYYLKLDSEFWVSDRTD